MDGFGWPQEVAKGVLTELKSELTSVATKVNKIRPPLRTMLKTAILLS